MVEWRGKNANIAFSALKMIHYSNAKKKKKKLFKGEPLRNTYAWFDLASQGQHKVKTIRLFISFHIWSDAGNECNQESLNFEWCCELNSTGYYIQRSKMLLHYDVSFQLQSTSFFFFLLWFCICFSYSGKKKNSKN